MLTSYLLPEKLGYLKNTNFSSETFLLEIEPFMIMIMHEPYLTVHSDGGKIDNT